MLIGLLVGLMAAYLIAKRDPPVLAWLGVASWSAATVIAAVTASLLLVFLIRALLGSP